MKSKFNENDPIAGNSSVIKDKKNNGLKEIAKIRNSQQPLLPLYKGTDSSGTYDIYPSFSLAAGKILHGMDSLVDYILENKIILIDGYVGVLWEDIKGQLKEKLQRHELSVCIYDTKEWFYEETYIDEMIAPDLGERSSVWGTKTDKELLDFFNPQKIKLAKKDEEADINIVIGCGAALCEWDATLIYVDLPKNELQFRMRAESINNLGKISPDEGTEMYKRFYFVDWIVLDKHKKAILNRINVIVDEQRHNEIVWMYARDLWKALKKMSETVFRVRPWFEAGAWGGQWMKDKIAGINKEEVNYAWSFELITPENGLLLESDRLLLEISFDWLMFTHKEEILGEKYVERFSDEFPIRFDFLDTVDGGNLSVQCHPSLKYIKEQFGENITQDETYYILDAQENAGVYLGFQENIEPQKFRNKLEKSNEQDVPIEITDYVQLHPAKKHDLFLIPNGTVHSAGAGNLVLEISATPYIFTFKMYDWLRLDLDEKPRPINIEHAFNNLNFSRKGKKVKKELIPQAKLINSGDDWQLYHLPTHPEHFYDIHRYEFLSSVKVSTGESCNVLMLVEGTSIMVEMANGFKQKYHYAETFVIPAAAGSYILTNESGKPAKVVKAFLK